MILKASLAGVEGFEVGESHRHCCPDQVQAGCLIITIILFPIYISLYASFLTFIGLLINLFVNKIICCWGNIYQIQTRKSIACLPMHFF